MKKRGRQGVVEQPMRPVVVKRNIGEHSRKLTWIPNMMAWKR